MLATVLSTAAGVAPPDLGTSAWWADFLTSPGFAGAAAVTGALLGFIGVLVNNYANRKGRERDRWWEMYQRVEGALATYSPARATMVVEALARSAKTLFEQQLVSALLDDLTPPAPEQDKGGGPVGAHEAQEEDLEDLEGHGRG